MEKLVFVKQVLRGLSWSLTHYVLMSNINLIFLLYFLLGYENSL